MGTKSGAICIHIRIVLPLNLLSTSPLGDFQQNSHSIRQLSSLSVLSFQRSFLLLYSLSSVMEGLWSMFGEYELSYYGLGREHMVLSLCAGYAAALYLGTFLGMLSDLISQKKICLIFCILHLFVGMLKRVIAHPSVWSASICLSLGSSIFSFSFETWMVAEHDKQGHRQDTLNDLFWLMTFTDSASFISSQVIANWPVGSNVEKSVFSPSTAAVLLAILSIIFVTRGCKEGPQTASLKDYRISLNKYIFGDKRVWLLAWAQACIHFSIAVFWILWAPTIVGVFPKTCLFCWECPVVPRVPAAKGNAIN